LFISTNVGEGADQTVWRIEYQTNSSVFVWGAQLEEGSVATSYIKTTNATATRSADNISLTGASDLIGQTSGFLYALVDVRELGAIARGMITVSDGTTNARVQLSFSETASNRIRLITTGSIVIDIDNVSEGKHSIVGTYSATGGCRLYFDGQLIGTAGNASFGGLLTHIYIGATFAGGSHFNDHIFLAGNGKTALTESEAIALSGAHL
jgi:hypothetical protein